MRNIIYYLLIFILCGTLMADKDILGGFTEQSTDNPDIQKMAIKATSLIQKEYTKYKFVKVHRSGTQIVAGTNYYLFMEFETAQQHIFMEMILYKTLGQIVSITEKKIIRKEQKSSLDDLAKTFIGMCLKAQSLSIKNKKKEDIIIMIYKDACSFHCSEPKESKRFFNAVIYKPVVDIIILGFEPNKTVTYRASKKLKNESDKKAIKRIKSSTKQQMQKINLYHNYTKKKGTITINATTGNVIYTAKKTTK